MQSFLLANVVPARRAKPGLAPALVSTEKQLVPSPRGVLAAWRIGDGPAVLLVHGWEDDNSLWAPLTVARYAERPLAVAEHRDDDETA